MNTITTGSPTQPTSTGPGDHGHDPDEQADHGIGAAQDLAQPGDEQGRQPEPARLWWGAGLHAEPCVRQQQVQQGTGQHEGDRDEEVASPRLLPGAQLSAALLLAVPVVDVVLVTASLIDVAQGSRPGTMHGLAAVYLGFTVAFGHSTIQWVDARFAHRFAGGPTPVRPPRYGAARVAHEWREWRKVAVAGAITVGVLLATATVAGTGVPPAFEWFGDPMWNWGGRISVVAAVWFLCGPLWTTLSPPVDARATGRVDV